MRTYLAVTLGLAVGFAVGDLATWPSRPHLTWEAAQLVTDHERSESYNEGYREAAKDYSYTGYVINRANVRCSSTGVLLFSDMNIDMTGMVQTLRIDDDAGLCVDNSDRRF